MILSLQVRGRGKGGEGGRRHEGQTEGIWDGGRTLERVVRADHYEKVALRAGLKEGWPGGKGRFRDSGLWICREICRKEKCLMPDIAEN